jgi:hypothetical protein
MVVRLRRVVIIVSMASVLALTVACTPGGGGAASPGTGGSAAPGSQAPAAPYGY